MKETTFGGFTDQAKQALIIAQQEAQRLGSYMVEPEHLLLGIIADSHGIATRILHQLGATPQMLRKAVEAKLRSEDPIADEIRPSEQTKEVIKFSVYEVRRMGQRRIDAAHLLLGILNLEQGDLPHILKKQGIVVWFLRGATRIEARIRLRRLQH